VQGLGCLHPKVVKHEITILPRFFFQQQQRETNLYFLLNNKQQQWPSMSNITSLPWTKEDREKRRKRRRKALKCANTKLAPKKQ
jgi:hypothetical protein